MIWISTRLRRTTQSAGPADPDKLQLQPLEYSQGQQLQCLSHFLTTQHHHHHHLQVLYPSLCPTRLALQLQLKAPYGESSGH